MAPAPVLTIGLQTVRSEFNSVFPKRDKASDGWIGDLAHQLESASGHNPDITGRAEYKDGDSLNEVRAIDVDDDLRDASGNKVTFEKVVQYLVQKARKGDYVPFRYIIYNKRIWARSTGWKTQTYHGPSPHTEHGHFSGDYNQKADGWKGSLGLASLTKKPTPAKPPVPTKPGALAVHKLGSRTIKQGSVGTDVKQYQAFIGKVTASGTFDAKTTARTKAYQKMRGLAADGIAGPKTLGPIVKALGIK